MILSLGLVEFIDVETRTVGERADDVPGVRKSAGVCMGSNMVLLCTIE